MWPAPFIQINWIGLNVGQMFYISLEWMLFYRSRTHIHTAAHWLIHSVIHSKSREIRCWRTDATQQHTTSTVVQTVQSVQCTHAHTFSKHAFTVFSHCAYPCIVQGKFKHSNSGSLGSYLSEEKSRHMRYDENIHVPLINVHVHWYRLAGWLVDCIIHTLAYILKPMLNRNTLYVDADRMENAPFTLNRIIAIVTVVRRRNWATPSYIHGEV